MVYLLKMVIFHGYVSHNQMVTSGKRSAKTFRSLLKGKSRSWRFAIRWIQGDHRHQMTRLVHHHKRQRSVKTGVRETIHGETAWPVMDSALRIWILRNDLAILPMKIIHPCIDVPCSHLLKPKHQDVSVMSSNLHNLHALWLRFPKIGTIYMCQFYLRLPLLEWIKLRWSEFEWPPTSGANLGETFLIRLVIFKSELQEAQIFVHAQKRLVMARLSGHLVSQNDEGRHWMETLQSSLRYTNMFLIRTASVAVATPILTVLPPRHHASHCSRRGCKHCKAGGKEALNLLHEEFSGIF